MSLCHNLSHMKGGTLEVFLANAEDIRHTNILGTPVYYVIAQLGIHEHRSRVSKGKDAKVTWNEKFKFELPMSHWKRDSHMKFRIMDREFFSDGGFVGETIIHLGGIISEGNYRGFIEVKPAPYNVVLEDDTYKGQMKIGFKFTPHVSMLRQEIHPGILTLSHLDKKFNIPRRVNSHHFAE